MSNREAIQRALAMQRPASDDELAGYIRAHLGFTLSRRAVCPDHVAPFQFIADAFFGRFERAALLGPRGGGKTRALSIMDWMTGLFKPNTWMVHVGAIEMQAKRGYDYVKSYVENPIYKGSSLMDGRPFEKLVLENLASSTRWANGSVLEILPGTMNAVSGPHPNVKIADEVEKWKRPVWQQFVGMGVAEGLQTIYASTRERRYGLMQEILSNSERMGLRVYPFCIWEIMQRCPTCDKAGCILWEHCQGRGLRAGGHIPRSVVIDKFLQSDAETWATQQECLLPGREGLVYQELDDQANFRSDVAEYDPELEIELGCDDGYVDPRVMLFIQVKGDGRAVVIDELYQSKRQIHESIDALDERIKERGYTMPTRAWCGSDSPEFAAAMSEYGIPTTGATHNVVEGIKLVRGLIRDVRGEHLLQIHRERCPNLTREMLGYHYPDDVHDERPAKEDDHAPDALRYWAHGRYRIGRVEVMFA